MQVDERAQQLSHNVCSFPLAKMLPVKNVVKEFATGAVLKDKEADFVPLEDLVQFDNVGMILKRGSPRE